MARSRSIPIACTLADDEVEPRIDAWRGVLGHARAIEPLPDGVRIRFDGDVAASEVAELAAAEHACCAFMSFAVVIDAAGLALEIHGSDDARPVIDALASLGLRDC